VGGVVFVVNGGVDDVGDGATTVVSTVVAVVGRGGHDAALFERRYA
jgi:hypothetical protein